VTTKKSEEKPLENASDAPKKSAPFSTVDAKGALTLHEHVDQFLRASLSDGMRWIIRSAIDSGWDWHEFREGLRRKGAPPYMLLGTEAYWQWIDEMPDDDPRRVPGSEPR